MSEDGVAVTESRQSKKNEVAYIAEAALEYFISLLVGGAFLATLQMNIGMSDAVAGVMTSLASFGYTAQLFAVLFVRPKGSGKRMITVLHFINQLLFVLLYLVPYINVAYEIKLIAFIVMFLGGHFISHVAMPFKLNWLNSYVPDKKRGRFTASKEMVSLLGGTVFSFGMGQLIDYFDAMGNSQLGFILSGVTIFVLCILHLVTLLVVKDDSEAEARRAVEPQAKHSVKSVLALTLGDKKVRAVILLDIIWHVGTGISNSFFSVYVIDDLGFTIGAVTVITALGSLARFSFSKLFGRIADKYSWANMLTLSFFIGALAYLAFAFAAPGICRIFYIIYHIIHGIFMAGANSGIMNITFDYISHENRSYALGVKSALGGFVAFLASLVGAQVVEAVQANDNVVFGVTVYAPQILSAITFIVFLLVVVYIRTVIYKMKKVDE